MGNIETTTKFSRLKSIPSIEDNYLEGKKFRGSHRRCSIKRPFLKIFAILLESLFNKVVGLHVCTFVEKRLQHRCFPVHIANFLTPILKNIFEWLLLIILLL